MEPGEGTTGRAAPPDGAGLPLSYAQQGMWFLERRAGTTRFADPMTFRLVGALDATALRESIEELVRRHEAPRTTFPVVDGRPVQRVAPRVPVPLPLTDLTALPAAEREDAAARFLAEDLRRPFDLAGGPLIRAALLRLAPREHIVRITLHHLVSDAWSWWAVLLRELERLYAARLAGQPSPLPPAPSQYADFVRWQHDWLAGPAYPGHLTYWKRTLADVTPLPPLTLARPAPPGDERPSRTRWLTFPQPLYERLRATARRERVTLFMLLFAAFTRVLRRYVDTDDILVATRGGFRTRAEFEKAVGFFVNLLPVRTRVSEDEDFRELLHQVRRTLLGVYAHRDVPFERLTADLGLRRPGFRPTISVCVSFQTTPEVPPALEGLEVTPVDHDPFSAYPLDLGFYEVEGTLRALLTHRPDQYDDTAAGRLLDDLRQVLDAV
ncbi:condensation domain-containing protein [Streptomyces sp. AC627_RSS907]|uniref:condensation domain-containing protein n=1 Tax=Streptomyces sp. AC627_RSS907 TaxID=2823684 RepID=UPI001C26BE7B|nr:condensation domain-containing protein [Streptomyces sp. AC627_RSS907]